MNTQIPAWVAFLDSIIAITIPILVLVAAMLAGRVSRVEQHFVFSSIRRASSIARKNTHRTASHKCIKALAALIRAHALDKLRGSNRTVADLVSDCIGGRSRAEYVDDMAVLWQLASLTASRQNQSAVARLTWSAQLAIVSEECELLAAYLERDYLGKEPVRIDARRRRFADAVSLYSGAYVLADGLTSRSGVFSRVFVSHSLIWQGPADPHPKRSGGRSFDELSDLLRDDSANPSPYEAVHRGRDITTLRVADQLVDTGLDPGDYDARILSLRAVRPLVDVTTGELVIELSTVESCSAVAEFHPDYRCEHLDSDLALDSPSCVRVEFAQGAAVVTPGHDHVITVNSCITVMSHREDGVSLLLSHQSGRRSYGESVLSVTSGGTVEHSRFGNPGDQDRFGAPDPLRAALRELREELGIDLDDDGITPVAVFLSNSQGPPRDRSSAEGGAVDRSDGEVAVTICFLANTEQSADDIERGRALHADWARGRFQLESVQGLDLRPVPRDGGSGRRSTAGARSLVADLESRAGVLDQDAVISALYAGVHLYGVDAMLDSLIDGARQPWWAQPWHGDPTGAPRIVGNPGVMFGARAELIAAVQPEWAAAYRALADPV